MPAVELNEHFPELIVKRPIRRRLITDILFVPRGSGTLTGHIIGDIIVIPLFYLAVIAVIGSIIATFYVCYISGCLLYGMFLMSAMWYMSYKSNPKMHNLVWKVMLHAVLHPRTRLS